MSNNNQAWYISSTGQGVSLTLKGILVGLVPLISGLSKVYGYDVPEGEILELVETVFQVVSLGMVLIGLGRKLLYRFKPRG